LPEFICNTSPLQYLHQLGRLEILHHATSTAQPPMAEARDHGSDALDQKPGTVQFRRVSFLLTSQLKQRTGKILDAAARKPQFVLRGGVLFVIAKVDAEAALLDAAEQATGLKVSRPGLTVAERQHRNAILRALDDSEGW
jgi:hypothetical protein